MGTYIIADNQELSRFALETIIKQDDSNTLVRASDKTTLVEKLKEHDNAVVLLDYTLFDFADEDQLLIVAERFAKSQWILISDDLTPEFLRRVVYSSHQFSIVYKDGPLKDIRDAIEAASDFQLGHGSSVAAGLCCIARASAAKGWCSQECARQIEYVTKAHGLPVDTQVDHETLLRYATHDKKRHGSTINVVVPVRIGAARIQTITLDEMRTLVELGCSARG